jgi:hypothetical protein
MDLRSAKLSATSYHLAHLSSEHLEPAYKHHEVLLVPARRPGLAIVSGLRTSEHPRRLSRRSQRRSERDHQARFGQLRTARLELPRITEKLQCDRRPDSFA